MQILFAKKKRVSAITKADGRMEKKLTLWYSRCLPKGGTETLQIS